MYDKAYTFKTANEVLKNVIIPKITDGVAKEQAIALVSVLKNLETNTVENIASKEEINLHITRTICEYIQKLRSDSKHFPSCGFSMQLEELLQETVYIKHPTEKWKRLNELQCQLLQFLYKERLSNAAIEPLYINPLRKRIREQLTIEMASVR